jgi:hypothetical protein
MERLRMRVLEIPKGLPKPKSPRASEWTKYDGKRIELPVATEVMER